MLQVFRKPRRSLDRAWTETYRILDEIVIDKNKFATRLVIYFCLEHKPQQLACGNQQLYLYLDLDLEIETANCDIQFRACILLIAKW